MSSSAFSMWMTVVGGFLSYFLADGCTYSAGILFTEFKDIFHAGSTATSLLPALVYAIPQFLSPFICPFTAIVGYSTAAAWGSLFLCISFIGRLRCLRHARFSDLFGTGDHSHVLCVWRFVVTRSATDLYGRIYGRRIHIQGQQMVGLPECHPHISLHTGHFNPHCSTSSLRRDCNVEMYLDMG